MKSSSSSSGGGASFFFFSYFLGAYFLGASVATGAEDAAGAGPTDPICLVPSAIKSSIFFPLTDSRSLLISASSQLAEAVPRTFLISAAPNIRELFTDIFFT